MPYKVIVEHPSIGDESNIFIHGLGTFKNNTETVIDEDQIEHFRSAHSIVIVSNPHPVTGTRVVTTTRGKHPVDLEFYGVRVVKVEDSKDEESTGEEVEAQ